jgi:hypothetical protein
VGIDPYGLFSYRTYRRVQYPLHREFFRYSSSLKKRLPSLDKGR